MIFWQKQFKFHMFQKEKNKKINKKMKYSESTAATGIPIFIETSSQLHQVLRGQMPHTPLTVLQPPVWDCVTVITLGDWGGGPPAAYQWPHVRGWLATMGDLWLNA